MRKLIYLVIIVIIAVVLFLSRGTQTPDDDKVNTGPEAVTPEKPPTTGVMSLVKNDASVQTTTLKPVNGSNSSGTAYRLVKDAVLYHTVVASMPDPNPGNSYEGWLVQISPLKFFSTGILEKNSNGDWTLEYTADQENPTYLRVVITEETVIDATPEAHVLEGDF
ncbi:MAG: hypothetical protein HYW51_03635 [Candidatus Doudnabacteria bacterium]|nr:hypothetical protein [Candidatus Doudnabacteria bacterium]